MESVRIVPFTDFRKIYQKTDEVVATDFGLVRKMRKRGHRVPQENYDLTNMSKQNFDDPKVELRPT